MWKKTGAKNQFEDERAEHLRTDTEQDEQVHVVTLPGGVDGGLLVASVSPEDGSKLRAKGHGRKLFMWKTGYQYTTTVTRWSWDLHWEAWGRMVRMYPTTK